MPANSDSAKNVANDGFLDAEFVDVTKEYY